MPVPPCGLMLGKVPEVTNVQLPAVPEVSTTVQPVLLSRPLLKRVELPQVAEKVWPPTFAPLMVTERLAGANVQPLFVGVTV